MPSTQQPSTAMPLPTSSRMGDRPDPGYSATPTNNGDASPYANCEEMIAFKSDEPTGDFEGRVVGNRDVDDIENTPPDFYQGSRLTRCAHRIIPHGGFVSNTYTFSAVTVGAGIISLPSAFNKTGFALAVIIICVCMWSTTYSIHLLAKVTEKTRLNSYEAMSRHLLGRGWDYFMAFVIWFFTFGILVSYVISIGNLLTPALQPTDEEGNMIVLENLPSFLQTKAGNRCLTSLVWLVVMLPLSLPKQINSLRYASFVGVSCMMYFVICIVVHAARGFENGRSKHKLAAFRSGNDVVVGFSLFLFSFMCQTNFFKVYGEMQKPSPGRITRQISVSMSICFTLYIIAGMMGYADFGDAIDRSILLFYDVRSDVMIAIAYFGIAFKLCVGFALCMHPLREAIFYCIGWDVQTLVWWKRTLVCGANATCALILGLFIPNVNVVFSLTGSFCGGIIGFIFPALFVMYGGDWTLKKVGLFYYVSTYVLLVLGVVALCFGTIAAIYGEV